MAKTSMASRVYRFFPGCIASVKLPFIERSSRELISMLEISIADDPRFTCCPDPVVFKSASRKQWFERAKRNLTLDGGDPILTLCPGCKSTLAEVGLMLKIACDAGRIDDASLSISSVFHLVEVLVGDGVIGRIKQMTKRDLSHLKVGLHYGCHLLKPSEIVGFDDPDMPLSLARIVESVDASIIEYKEMLLCCGKPSLDESTSLAMLRCKVDSIREAGCNLIVVACPFCFEQLDLGQLRLKTLGSDGQDIPVVYISQLILFAVGGDYRSCGFDWHRIRPNVLLERF